MKQVQPASRVLASHGLGNQLFQFTFAHFLKRQDNLVFFENTPIWSPGLEFYTKSLLPYCTHINFRTNPTISHTSLIGRALYRTNLAGHIARCILNFKETKTYFESTNNSFFYDAELIKLAKNNLLFSGHWVHWQYAYSERNTALNEIQNLLNSFSSIKTFMDSTLPNVVVHVRRGDYLQRGNDQLFGVITIESYEKQINSLRRKLGQVNLITVTDDLNLANNDLFKNKFGKILTPSICNEWESLSLMSKADFVISANSTLSWWGAVMATMNGAVGIIPENFYKNINSKDAFSFPGLVRYSNEHY